MSAAAAAAPGYDGDEPDRLSGFPAPREVARVFGHEAARAEFETALSSGRLHHGWLLTGPEGIGKAALAYGLARRLLGANEGIAGAAADDASAPLFHLVAGRAHPNLLILNRSYNDKTKRYSQVIGVDEVRRLRAFLSGSASRPGWRVVIVDRADELNQNAANALLKALEEPPAKTVFLLVAGAEGRLPVTIRSRCRTLHLRPLDEAALAAAVDAALAAAGEEIAPDALATALDLAEGAPRRALTLAAGEGASLYVELLGAFRRLPDLDGVWLNKLADKLSAPSNQDSFELFYGLLLSLIERLVRIAATGEGGTEAERALAGLLITDQSLGVWAELWQALAKAKAETSGLNLDKGLLLLDSFARLQAAASGRG